MPRKAGLVVLELSVGYGFGDGYLRALAAAAIMVLIGFLTHRIAVPARPRVPPHLRSLYSIGTLVPLISLYPFADDRRAGLAPRFSPLGVWYFALHRLIGALLVAVIVAAVSGLTQGNRLEHLGRTRGHGLRAVGTFVDHLARAVGGRAAREIWNDPRLDTECRRPFSLTA